MPKNKKNTEYILNSIINIFEKFNIICDKKNLLSKVNNENYILKIKILNNKKEKFLLKYKITDSDAEPLKREILFHQKCNKIINYQKSNIKLQNFIKANIAENARWLLLSYADGNVLGNAFAIETLKLKDKKLQNLLLETPFFIHSVKNIGWIKKLGEKDAEWMLKELSDNKKVFLRHIPVSSYDLTMRIIENNAELINQRSYYLCHRDNHPGNFIYDKKNSVLTIIDWTDLCVSNYMYDFTDIWLHSWQYPKAQKEYLNKFLSAVKRRYGIENNEHIKLFDFTALILLIKEFVYLNDKRKIDWAFGGRKWNEVWRNKALKIHHNNFSNILNKYV